MLLPIKRCCAALLSVVAGWSQPATVAVETRPAARITRLPGELRAYQSVRLQARVNGYVEKILVDRGSRVKAGDPIAILAAPELLAQRLEAEARVASAQSALVEAEARLASAEAVSARLKKASETPGAIAGLEVLQAEKQTEAARASVDAVRSTIRAAQAAVTAAKQNEQYLRVTAPFSGLITERMIHPGALVGPGSGAEGALVELQQVSPLRLIVPVPELDSGALRRGARVSFQVAAYPGREFTGTVARISRALNAQTRTMPVELDVSNSKGELAPGMLPDISLPSGGSANAMLVPPTAVVTTTERTFVIRAKDGRAEWVNVKKGRPAGDLIEIFGPLAVGDRVLRRGSDEIRNGAELK